MVKQLETEREILEKATICVLWSCMIDEGLAPRHRLAGVDVKLPQSAVLKRLSGER